MQTRRLGRTGYEVTPLGLGGAHLATRGATHEDAFRTVWAALEAGCNLLDSSPHYGLGLSEILIGRALRQRPDLAKGVYLSTKTGHYGSKRDYSYETTRRSVGLSLERLGVNHLDIVHIHDVWSAAELAEVIHTRAALRALQDYRDEGVVGAIGIGTKSLEALELAVDSGAFEVFMIANDYDLLSREGGEVITKARAKDVGVIIAGAYATGILARGSADPLARYRYRPPTDEVRARVAGIEEVCRAWSVTLPAAAVQFCLRGPAEQAVIALGARTADQVRANVAAVEQAIPEGFWAALAALE